VCVSLRSNESARTTSASPDSCLRVGMNETYPDQIQGSHLEQVIGVVPSLELVTVLRHIAANSPSRSRWYNRALRSRCQQLVDQSCTCTPLMPGKHLRSSMVVIEAEESTRWRSRAPQPVQLLESLRARAGGVRRMKQASRRGSDLRVHMDSWPSPVGWVASREWDKGHGHGR